MPQPTPSPICAAGCSDATLTASAMSAASIITNPPTTSFASINGPSVTTGVPFFGRIVRASHSRLPRHELPGRAQLGVVDLALGRHRLELLLSQGFHLFAVAVGQTDELHGRSPFIV